MRDRVVALSFAALVALSACGEDAAKPAADAAGVDVSGAGDAAATCKHPTPPQDSCQERWCDNELGVGMPCTNGGGECLANKDKADLAAVICTASQAKEAFCTLPCVDDEDCGKGAVCRGDPKNPKSGKGCVLVTCAGPAPSADASDAVSQPDTASPTD